MSKYELTEEFCELNGKRIYRIRALVDFGVVSKGDLGGFVESELNLDQRGFAWVSGDAKIFGDAWISGDARVFGSACVSGDAQIFGSAWISGSARISGDARVYGDASVSGDAHLICGNFLKSPLYIEGSRFAITVNSLDCIFVGCTSMSLCDWRTKHLRLANNYHFSLQEKKEYLFYLNMIEEYFKL